MKDDIAKLLLDPQLTGAVQFDGLDEAIVGTACLYRNGRICHVIVYSDELCTRRMMKDGMNHEEAFEYLQFNVYDAWLGDRTPVVLFDMSDWHGMYPVYNPVLE
jgi:hypothetical protein